MARRIVSWGGNEHIVSVDSILQDKPDTSPTVQGTPHAVQSRTTNMASQVMGPSKTRTRTSTSTYPGADAADGSFVRHPKYFFKDGNVAFLVDNTLYCVHRYFLSRDSIYFSTRFTHLDIHDHEAFPTTISLGDIAPKDFDAFLSVLYPENFKENNLCHEEWKSVLHLSTRWSFSSIRELALSSIEPPTPYDRLILARTYSVDDWVVPALSALCERTTPLTLSEACQMNIEDVILISSVREHIRGGTIQVNAAEIPLLVEAEQLLALGHGIPLPSSRESEDDTLMASAWHSRSRPEKAEAEARAKAQVVMRFRLAKERAEAEAKGRQEARKARLEVEAEKERKDAEKALAKKKAMEAAKKLKADAIAEADAKAKTAKSETKRQAELEAEAQTEEARTKAKVDEANKAKAEEGVKAKDTADRKAETVTAEEPKVIADAEAKVVAEKAEQETATRAHTAEAEAAAAERAKKEKQRQRAEKLKEAELQRAKAAKEQVARQRAADNVQKAARLAPGSPAASPISSRSSGGGWLFSKVSQAVVSAIVTPADEPRSSSSPVATGSSDLFSRLQIKNPSSPNVELGPRNPSVMWQSSSNPFRGPLCSPSATSGTTARSSASVLSTGTTVVSEEVSTAKNTQEGAEGAGKGTQAQTASETPATSTPSAEQAGSDEAKASPAEAIVAEQSTPDVAEPTQTGDGAAQSAVPDAPVEQSTSSGPISSEADNTQAPESTPRNAAADPEARNAPEAPFIPLADSPSVSPPVPAKDAVVVNMPDPASHETSTSSLQTPDPAALEAVNPDNAGEDAKLGGPPKFTLPMDRFRRLCAAADKSSFEISVDDAGLPAVEGEEEGGPGEPGTPGKSKRKKRSKNKKKGGNNSLRPASGATGNDVDNPTEQDTRPVIALVIADPDLVDVPGGEGNGVLVEKADSSGDDSAVFVDAPQAVTEVEKAADATASGSDEWNVWS